MTLPIAQLSLNRLAAIRDEHAAARQQHESALQQLNQSTVYTDEHKRSETARIKAAFDAKRLELDAEIVTVTGVLNRHARHEPATGVEAVLNRQNAWLQAKSSLDTGDTIEELIERVEPDDTAMIDALHAEYEAYARAEAGRTATSAANKVEAQRQASTAAKAAMARLDLVEAKAPGDRGANAKVRAAAAALLPSVDTESEGAAMDLVGQPLAGHRRMAEGYAQGDAERAQQAVSDAVFAG